MKCGYIRQTWDCGNTREVEEKHTGRYGARGQKRQKRRKATPEEIAKQNQWKRERDVRRLIKWNFGIGDYWFTLTYKKGSRPPWKQMQKDMSKFIRKLRDNGDMVGDLIAIKYTLEITWPMLSRADAAKIDAAISPAFFNVTFTDPGSNSRITKRCYSNTPSYPVYSYVDGVKTYKGVGATLIGK